MENPDLKFKSMQIKSYYFPFSIRFKTLLYDDVPYASLNLEECKELLEFLTNKISEHETKSVMEKV